MIALIKNGRDVWDQTVQRKALGATAHKEKEKKLRSLFTSGIGKKKEQGKRMLSKEGVKYFKQAETEWIGVYHAEKLMRILHSGWEGQLEKKGKEMTVEEDSDKNLHSVMAMWTEEEDAKNKGVEKGNNNESKICPSESEGQKEEGYSSGMDLRKMPSRRWLQDARRKSNKGNGTPGDNRGRESEDEELSNERDSAGKKRKLGRRGMSVLAVWRLVR
jgi:hypothetical protein